MDSKDVKDVCIDSVDSLEDNLTLNVPQRLSSNNSKRKIDGMNVRGDLCLTLVTKKRIGKCVGASRIKYLEVRQQQTVECGDNYISNDIWLHISDHIPPEDVKSFALICQQTAAIVKTRHFWKNLLRRYYNKSLCNLPNTINKILLENSDIETLRCIVIKVLFTCYAPLKKFIELGYKLKSLIGRSYVSSWHKKCQQFWIMCYKFWNRLSVKKQKIQYQIVENWESLTEENLPTTFENGNPFEGVSILVIRCRSFVPFPTTFLHDNRYGEGHIRLVATKELLSKDIKSTNLELIFKNSVDECITTIRYPMIVNFEIIPWWHPKFNYYINID